jgi:hypothetical protein
MGTYFWRLSSHAAAAAAGGGWMVHRTSEELLLNPVLICRTENEKVLIEPSINSLRISVKVRACSPRAIHPAFAHPTPPPPRNPSPARANGDAGHLSSHMDWGPRALLGLRSASGRGIPSKRQWVLSRRTAGRVAR